MNVLVMNREQAKAFSFQKHNFSSVIISITDPNKEPVIFNRSSLNGIKWISRLSFWDEETDEHACISIDQANKIASDAILAIGTDTHTLIVHCEAGKCRSAGVAAAILKAFTNDDMQIFGNPYYTPNMMCYRRVLNALVGV